MYTTCGTSKPGAWASNISIDLQSAPLNDARVTSYIARKDVCDALLRPAGRQRKAVRRVGRYRAGADGGRLAGSRGTDGGRRAGQRERRGAFSLQTDHRNAVPCTHTRIPRAWFFSLSTLIHAHHPRNTHLFGVGHKQHQVVHTRRRQIAAHLVWGRRGATSQVSGLTALHEPACGAAGCQQR